MYKQERNDFGILVHRFFTEIENKNRLSIFNHRLNLFKEDELTQEELFKKLAELKLVIAGGAITSLFTGAPVNDLDFYMEDSSRKDEIFEFFSKYFKERPYISSNCITFKRKNKNSTKRWTIQLITRFTGGPYALFDDFDFTITTGAFSFNDNKFYFGDRFFTDIGKRKLVFIGNSNYPICALFRTKKYQARGYSLPGSTVMHIGLSIVRLKINTYKELKEQLLGIDTIYLQNLLNQGKYADNLPVDYGQFLADALEFLNVNSFETHDE